MLHDPATDDTEQRRRPIGSGHLPEPRRRRSGLLPVKLFAHRHIDPKTLQRAADPVGPADDDVLQVLTAREPRTIAAWSRTAAFNDLLTCTGRPT